MEEVADNGETCIPRIKFSTGQKTMHPAFSTSPTKCSVLQRQEKSQVKHPQILCQIHEMPSIGEGTSRILLKMIHGGSSSDMSPIS